MNTGIPRKKRRKKRAKVVDIKALALQYRDELIEALGIEYLGLRDSVLDDIVKDVLDAIVTSSSYKPSLDTLIKRINRYRKQLNKLIAARIIEDTDKLNEQQIEFVVYYGEEAIVQHIPDLYRVVKKIGREDLLDMLKYVWEKYGKPTPLSCPRCGFRTVMPNLSCMVCGYVVSEDYVRESIGFSEKFIEFLKNSSIAVLREVLDIGYVLVSDIDVRSPRERVDTFIRYYYPIYLRSSEFSAIIEEIGSRKIPI